MAARSATAATPAGTSFFPTPTTDVLPLDTSPESLSALGLAYSRVSSTPLIGTQRPGRTSRESKTSPSLPWRPKRPPPFDATTRPLPRRHVGATTHESRAHAPIVGTG